jgi:F0F1-type ATP synthase membrane subunit b/b'
MISSLHSKAIDTEELICPSLKQDVAREKYDSAKSRVQGTAKDAQAEGRGLFDKAEEKLEHANKTVKDNFNQTRDSTEALYREARDNAERKSAELRADADRKAQEAKDGWFSWLGSGKNKVEQGENAAKEGKDKLDTEAERLRKEAARGVANAAEDVRVKAEKRT